MFFSLRDEDAPLRHGRIGPPMAQCAALLFSSALPNNSYPGQGERTEFNSDFDSTQVAQSSMAGRDNPLSVCLAMAPPITHGPPVPCKRGNPTLTWTGWLSGPGPREGKLKHIGAPPTCYCYYSEGWSLVYMLPLWLQVACVWGVVRGVPANIISVLSHWCFGLLAAIAACHVGFDGTTVGQHALIFS